MRQPKRLTVAEQGIDLLRTQILSNELPPGAVVTEEAMARELGVSRPTMREVLGALIGEGLLTRDHRTRGLKVTILSSDEVREIYTARRVIELAGVEASSACPETDLLRLAEAVDEMAKAVENEDQAGVVSADALTHTVTVSFLQSRYLTETHTQLMAQLRLVMSKVEHRDDRDPHDLLRTHQAYAKLVLERETQQASAQLRDRLYEAERLALAVLPGDHD